MTRPLAPGLVATLSSCLACLGASSADLVQPTDTVLSIAVDKSRFASDATLVVQIWESAQLAALGDRLELAATGVRGGERFRVRVAGTSADRCNTTSGEQTSTAEAVSTRVSLVWETTLKTCGQGGGV